jgi:phosphatidate cytidylyltransferase
LLAGVLALLVVATLVTLVATRLARSQGARSTLEDVRLRVVAWWAIVGVVSAGLLLGRAGALVLFALASLLALGEFSRLVDLRPVDRRVLALVALVIVPLQYGLLAADWYGLFVVLIPVYGFVLIAARSVLADDVERFLARTSALQWGVLACVYSLSHLPALLTLKLPAGAEPEALLLWLVLVVQLGDVCQYLWGKSLGRRRLAPRTSPNKTWAGAVGGIGSAAAIGAALAWATPFAAAPAAGLAALCAILGLLGDLTLSAVKRDAGVKDFGTLLPGHGGVLDRVDSLVLSAPVFFHLVRYLTTV